MAFGVKGKSIEELRTLDTSKLSEAELRAATQRLADAANKRVRRLMADEIGQYSQYAQEAKAKGGNIFTTKGKTTRSEVKAEFDRLRNFLNPSKQKTSVRGFRKFVKQMEKKGASRELLLNSDFWSTYRQFASRYVPAVFTSEDLIVTLSQLYGEGLRGEEIDERLIRIYEGREEDEEDYFGDIEEEYWGDYF